MPAGEGDKKAILFSITVHTDSGALPTFYSMSTVVVSRGVKRLGLGADHSLLVPMLRMSAVVPPPSLYAFMTCTFTFFSKKKKVGNFWDIKMVAAYIAALYVHKINIKL